MAKNKFFVTMSMVIIAVLSNIGEAAGCNTPDPKTVINIENKTNHDLFIEIDNYQEHRDYIAIDSNALQICVNHVFSEYLLDFTINISWGDPNDQHKDSVFPVSWKNYYIPVPLRLEKTKNTASFSFVVNNIAGIRQEHFEELEKVQTGEKNIFEKYVKSGQIVWIGNHGVNFSSPRRRRAARLWFEASYLLATKYYYRYRISEKAYISTLKTFNYNKRIKGFTKNYNHARSNILRYHAKVTRLVDSGNCQDARALSNMIKTQSDLSPNWFQVQKINESHIQTMVSIARNCENRN